MYCENSVDFDKLCNEFISSINKHGITHTTSKLLRDINIMGHPDKSNFDGKCKEYVLEKLSTINQLYNDIKHKQETHKEEKNKKAKQKDEQLKKERQEREQHKKEEKEKREWEQSEQRKQQKCINEHIAKIKSYTENEYLKYKEKSINYLINLNLEEVHKYLDEYGNPNIIKISFYHDDTYWMIYNKNYYDFIDVRFSFINVGCNYWATRLNIMTKYNIMDGLKQSISYYQEQDRLRNGEQEYKNRQICMKQYIDQLKNELKTNYCEYKQRALEEFKMIDKVNKYYYIDAYGQPNIIKLIYKFDNIGDIKKQYNEKINIIEREIRKECHYWESIAGYIPFHFDTYIKFVSK